MATAVAMAMVVVAEEDHLVWRTAALTAARERERDKSPPTVGRRRRIGGLFLLLRRTNRVCVTRERAREPGRREREERATTPACPMQNV